MFDTRLKELRKTKRITQGQFAQDLEVSPSAIAMWESAARTPPSDMLIKIAGYFGVTVDYLLGVDNNKPDFAGEDVLAFPVLAGVPAGFGNTFDAFETGEYQEIPRSVIKGRPPEDFFVFVIEGESMFPKFLDGDRVLVSKQDSVDSGDIAIISYEDYENGTIKKIYYEPGCDFLDLIPLNSKFKPVRIQGSKLEGTRIIGKVIYLFRKI